MTTELSHFGICVSDIERSTTFYVEALGFEKAERHTVGTEFGRLVELDEVSIRSQFLRSGDTVMELLLFDSPGFSGTKGRRPMNQLGSSGMTGDSVWP